MALLEGKKPASIPIMTAKTRAVSMSHRGILDIFPGPSIPGMIGKLSRAGFAEVSSVNVAATTCEEQRSTPWMSYQSLRDFLDPDDPGRTVEGFPAPVRAVFIGRKK